MGSDSPAAVAPTAAPESADAPVEADATHYARGEHSLRHVVADGRGTHRPPAVRGVGMDGDRGGVLGWVESESWIRLHRRGGLRPDRRFMAHTRRARVGASGTHQRLPRRRDLRAGEGGRIEIRPRRRDLGRPATGRHDVPRSDRCHRRRHLGLGPAGANPTGQPDLAIARYDHAADRWVYGPVYESDETTGPIVQGLFQLDGPVLWTGSEIVVWNGAAGGVAFDPSSETWRPLGPPDPPSGSVRDSTAVMTSAGLVAVVDVEDAERSRVDFALMVDGEWAWVDTEIPIGDFQTVTVAMARGTESCCSGDRHAPVTVHLPFGTWRRHDDGPLAGVEAPNMVWTGDRLIVWGGVAESAGIEHGSIRQGATWTPPPT